MNDKKTKEVLRSMFCESTGRSMLDSGGTPKYDKDGNYAGSSHGYGRGYERNQMRNFEAECTSRVEFSVCRGKLEVMYSKSAYHWLLERVTFCRQMDTLFQRFSEHPDQADESWFGCVDAFLNPAKLMPWLRKRRKSVLRDTLLEAMDDGQTFGGIYGEGEPITENTYNSENTLDETLQFAYFEVSGLGGFILLQTHNGCDVRGGYSMPRVFEVDGECLFDYQTGRLATDSDVWYTDDAYHWYTEEGAGDRLEDMSAIAMDDLEDECENLKELTLVVSRGERQCTRMCELMPNKADTYRAQHAKTVEDLQGEIRELMFDAALAAGVDAVVNEDGDAYVVETGEQIVAA